MAFRFPRHFTMVTGLGLGLGVAGVLALSAAEEETQADRPAPEEAKTPVDRMGRVPLKATEGAVLWGALIFAVKDIADFKVDYDPTEKPLAERLGKVFPEFSHFQMLGQTSEELFKAVHSWVAPFKEVSVFFDSKGRAKDGGVKLDLQLWSQSKAILKADAVLKAGSPVIIEGPDWGKGRLLFMVELQETKREKGREKR